MPRTLPSEMDGRKSAASVGRASLAERIARTRGERAEPCQDRSGLDRERRKPFEASPLLRDHADELLAITGELARVLPSRAEYRAHVGEDWGEGRARLSSRARTENPACTFVWEVKHNEHGLLGSAPTREYNWALKTTDELCDLWEGEPDASEAELAKALIVQTVLCDDELRGEVLDRVRAKASAAAGTLGPYFSAWKR